MVCMGFSAYYHIFFGLFSNKYSGFLLRLDYSGTCVLIWGGSVGIYYYGFYCQPYYLYLYTTMSTAISLFTFTALLKDDASDLLILSAFISQFILEACPVLHIHWNQFAAICNF